MMIGESECGEERRHNEGRDDRICSPASPCGFAPKSPCEKEKHEQGGVERDKVKIHMEWVVDEDGIADDANAPQCLKERNEKSAAATSEFSAQARGKGT